MNTPIFSTRLFCVVLLGSALSACASVEFSGARPEIAQPLDQAVNLWRHGDERAALENVIVAQEVPNQTAQEKGDVAHVKAVILSNSYFPRRGQINDALANMENGVLINTPAYTGGPPPPPLQAPPPNPH